MDGIFTSSTVIVATSIQYICTPQYTYYICKAYVEHKGGDSLRATKSLVICAHTFAIFLSYRIDLLLFRLSHCGLSCSCIMVAASPDSWFKR